MNQHEIVFTLSDKEKIVIQAEHPQEELHCCYDVPIVFFGETSSIVSETNVREALRALRKSLKKALAGQLKLHPSITQDLGYLSNEDLQDKPGLFCRKVEGIDWWVGWDYLLWGSGGDTVLNTWLYNDENGAIIFEITPSYSQYFGIKKKDPRYISYKDWIKFYKPLVIREIPREVAEKWHEQAKSICKKIDENIARIFPQKD